MADAEMPAEQHGGRGGAENSTDEAVWLEALTTYERIEMGRRKVELTSIIRPMLEHLQQMASREDLHALYHAGDEWWLTIAKNGYPNEPRMWERHRTADVAYGMRLAQLTGRHH